MAHQIQGKAEAKIGSATAMPGSSRIRSDT